MFQKSEHNVFCFCFYKMLINAVAAQKHRCRSSSWASIYEQTPQQLHPLGTRRDSGGHWNREPPLLGSLIYEPPHDKTNKMNVCLAKTQISMGGCPGWSEYSLGAHAILLVLSWGGSHSNDGQFETTILS